MCQNTCSTVDNPLNTVLSTPNTGYIYITNNDDAYITQAEEWESGSYVYEYIRPAEEEGGEDLMEYADRFDNSPVRKRDYRDEPAPPEPAPPKKIKLGNNRDHNGAGAGAGASTTCSGGGLATACTFCNTNAAITEESAKKNGMNWEEYAGYLEVANGRYATCFACKKVHTSVMTEAMAKKKFAKKLANEDFEALFEGKRFTAQPICAGVITRKSVYYWTPDLEKEALERGWKKRNSAKARK